MRVGIYSRLSVFIKGSVVIMQPIKNYLFDINGNRVIVFRSEDDAITLNNPFISIKVVNINNKVFIFSKECAYTLFKFIHFNNHYDAEVISLEYKDDTVFSMKTLSEEEFESFNAANIKQEIKKIIALNNIEKQVLLELLQQGAYLDDDMIVSKAKDQITFHARKDVSSDWQVSFDSKLNTLFMDNQHKNFKVEIEL